MYGAAAAGECPFCGDPIPAKAPGTRGRRRRYCGDPCCRTAYFRTYQRTYRATGHGLTRTYVVSRGTGNTPPGTVIQQNNGSTKG